MKVVWHQTPGEDVTDRFDILMTLAEEIQVIFFLEKDTLLIVTAVVDVINTRLMYFHKVFLEVLGLPWQVNMFN